MAGMVRVYLFGDQTYETNAKLCALLSSTGNPILASFLDQAFNVIRAEVGRLPLQQFRDLPSFTSLAEILARQRDGGLNPAFQTALSIIYQLGSFIRQHENSGNEYPQPSQTYLLGLCTGALSAVAISCCRTLSQLLQVAVATVRVAFRLGLRVVEVGTLIEAQSEASWSFIIPGMKHEAVSVILKEFLLSKNLPPVSRPWISAHIENGTSVGGPPSVLDELRKFPALSKIRTVEIPNRSPGHASHLFTSEDVSSILKGTLDLPWISYTSQIAIVSPATGKLMPGGNFKSLLEVSLNDIMARKLRWDLINQEFPTILNSSHASNLKLTPIGTTSEHALLSTLQNALASSGDCAVTPPLVEIEYQDFNQPRTPINTSGNPGLSKLAIVGMSGRFPESSSPEDFWEVLRHGVDTVKKVPPTRWSVDTHVDSSGKGSTSEVPWGCWLKGVELFDARFFSISPKEAPQVDPAQRIALMTTYEAIEEAGIVPGTTPSTRTDRIGVFHGVTGTDYMETNTSQDIDTHFITGGNRAFIPGRISFCYEFCGPSCSVDTACSSSFAAMHMACNALWRGDCDTAVSGGTNMISNPDGHAGLDRGFFISKTGNCKTFDDGADGYCRGEGVATVVIKRLEDAIADSDPVLALISGIKTNHSGEADSITRPHAPAQKTIFDQLLIATGTDINEIGYVEMHGTGTQTGDAVEMESVLHAFGPEPTSQKARKRDSPVFLGAAKANIGHGEGASGVTSLAKVLLMFRYNAIPPHCGITTKINHNYPLDFAQRNVHIAKKEIPWLGTPERPRKVLINNFSAAGGNTAVLLEDTPMTVVDCSNDPEPASSYLIAITAKCANSLKGNLKAMLHYMNYPDKDFSLPRLSYTTTARRIHHPHRVMLRGSDTKEVKLRLQEAIARGDGITRKKSAPKIVFGFTGQGSQYLYMGKQLFESFSQFRNDILRFDQISRAQGFPSFCQIFVATTIALEDFTPQVVQLAICCLQMALARLWISWGIQPETVIGHSLGEYAALNISGAISDSDTIYLVGKRAELLQEQCRPGTHAMLAVKASASRIHELLNGAKYEISCINGPEDTVLGGSIQLIASLQELLATHQVKATTLQVPYAFHTSQVFSMLGDFEAAVNGIAFHKPSIPVICPLLGNVITDLGTLGPGYLSRHCRETVNIHAALLYAKNSGFINEKCVFLEIGPNPVVSGMIKSSLGDQAITLHILQKNKDSWPLITAALSTLYISSHDIRWREYHKDFKASQKVLHLPAYAWDLKEYWIPYAHDWCLHKGAAPPMILDRIHPKVESTSIHKVVEERTSGKTVVLVVESDISRPDLNAIAQGHRVNGIPLTTPSVYAEIALSLGNYLMEKYQPAIRGSLVDVSNLSVEKALIPHSQGPQILRTSSTVDWTTKRAELKFCSVNDSGKVTVEHGECSIIFRNKDQLKEIQQKVQEYLSRIEYLRKGAESGRLLRLSQTYAYKLIGALAQFHPDYRAADEVTLDSSTMEASASVSFGQVVSNGTFSTHPAYIDVLTQTAGFVMNAKESTDLAIQVFVNHGWQSFQIFEEISKNKSYKIYVKMAQDEGEFWRGDTIMLDGTTVVAFFKGVTLRAVPRKVFNMVLDAANTKPPKKNQTPPPARTTPAPGPKAVKPPTKVTQIPPVVELVPPVQVIRKVELAEAAVLSVASPRSSPQMASALAIISEETGLALSDLTDDSVFSEIGVDSLLSMVISSRFREELGLDLDLEFSLFLDLPTIKHLRDFIEPATEGLSTDVDARQDIESPPQGETMTAIADNFIESVIVEKNLAEAQEGFQELQTPTSLDGVLGPALAIVAEESGLDIADLTDDTNFAQIGVDSLLSMVISSRFREELGLDLDLEFSLFLDLPTVKDLRNFLNPNAGGTPASSDDPTAKWSSSESTTPEKLTSEAADLTDDSEVSVHSIEQMPRPSCYCRPATSVILQGLPDRTEKTLFLFPDGGGSSSSYEPLPKLKVDVAVIGLNCPYVRDPENMLCNISDLMESYIAEIRRRQPHGPYRLGGWSSGGIFAYIATKMFLADGEEVSSLIIIDSPVPALMDKLPTHFYDYCDQLGLFGYSMGDPDAATPEWLIPHFNATVDVLYGHTVGPLDVAIGRMPKTSIIWACDTVLDGCTADWASKLTDSKGIHFLIQKRIDFGSAGWEKMLPGVEISCDKVVGANHFSMMHKPFIAYVGKFIERGIF
ncbi:beta-ketoacyl synthase [Bisporella sp. PMI_857]|nr:beta-ketoacyl synthase [Bisporella sp. PMI_857]